MNAVHAVATQPRPRATLEPWTAERLAVRKGRLAVSVFRHASMVVSLATLTYAWTDIALHLLVSSGLYALISLYLWRTSSPERWRMPLRIHLAASSFVLLVSVLSAQQISSLLFVLPAALYGIYMEDDRRMRALWASVKRMPSNAAPMSKGSRERSNSMYSAIMLVAIGIALMESAGRQNCVTTAPVTTMLVDTKRC